MKRLALAMVAAASFIAVPSPAAAASATCVYNNQYHQVEVAISGDTNALLGRDPDGHIMLNGFWCGGVATVTNTDHILVTGDSESQSVEILLANKGFKPGRTNEPGKSDEIEFTINMGSGVLDSVTIVGTDAVEKIDLGQNNTQFGIVQRINLNAGEKTGVDSDMALVNVDRVTIAAKGGNDVIRGRGKHGAGGSPIGISMHVYGGPGDDIIKGGEASDHLFGNEGLDKVWGFGGGDSVDLLDGEGGDIGYGGEGIDDCISDLGDNWHTN